MRDNKDLMDLYQLLFDENEFQIIQELNQGAPSEVTLDQLMRKGESEND